MAGRPPKTLDQHIHEGSFRPGRHEHLLASEPSSIPLIAKMQQRFQAAESQAERTAICREVAATLRKAQEELARRNANASSSSLETALARLGGAGSFKQLRNFFPTYLFHQAGERAVQPFTLERFQVEFLREFWRRDKHGRRIYKVAVLGIPKGNGKTPLAAGLGLHTLLTQTDAPQVYCIAGSRDQASIALNYARAWTENGVLPLWVKTGKAITCPQRNGRFQVLSSDGRLGQGVNPSAAIVDEWWLFKSEREQEAYLALANALHKRGAGKSWLLSITTAGYDLETQLGKAYTAAINDPRLELRDHGFLRVLRDEDSGFLFWWYGLPEACEVAIDDPSVIAACNPASWIDAHELARDLKRPDMNELDFMRLHLNHWTQSKDSWLPLGTWTKLRSDHEAPLGVEAWIGVDVALHHDTTAVAMAWKLEDGRIALPCHVWSANPDAKAHTYLQGGEIRLDLVEQHILELARRYRIREVAYDPRFFARSAQILGDHGLTLVEYQAAASATGNAYQDFHQACVEGRLTHDGDSVLQAHIDATAATRTDQGWKIRKANNKTHIDATIAVCLAHARASIAKPRRVPNIFWMET
jgi:phage terminase large subunit-like protein